MRRAVPVLAAVAVLLLGTLLVTRGPAWFVAAVSRRPVASAHRAGIGSWLPGHERRPGGTSPRTAGTSAPPSASPEPTSAASAPPLAPSAHRSGAGQAVPATIAADCSRDVTQALNSWMASLPDGSTLRFAAGGCYRVDGTLVLPDRHDLTLDGNGASFAASVTPPAQPKITHQLWSVVGGSDIILTNMALRGTNPAAAYDVNREWFPLIQIAGTQRVLVDGVQGSHSWGDFVSIGPDVRRVTNSDGTGAVLPARITIRGSTAAVIGRHGVACNGCDDVVIDGNSFSDVAYQILDIEAEAASWHARNVAFTDNTIGGTVHLSVLADAGIGHDVTGVTVSRNTMIGTPVTCAPPIRVDRTVESKSHFLISNNRFKTLGNAFWLRGVSGVTVQDNTVSVGNGGCLESGVAVIASDGEGNVVRENDFSGATKLVDAGTSGISAACGNRLSGTAFNQPQPCSGP